MATPPGRSSIGVRVRPNADNFIKDLDRQLTAKKKTFYVDVHANLKPANKDIAEWARGTLKKIRAVVPVGANMLPATTEVADWRRKQAANRTRIPIGVNLSSAYAEMLAFRKVAGKDIPVNLKINSESAGKAAERFSQAIARAGVTIPVHSDVKPARREIDTDLITRLKAGGGIVLPVKADTTSAANDIRAFSARAPKVQSQLDLDTKKARLELLQLRIKEKAKKLEVEVEVKKTALENFERSMQNIGKSFGKLNLIRSANLGPLTFGKPSGLIGTLATITSLAGAVPAATLALTALSKSLIDLGGAAAIVPGALGAVAASIGTLVLGSQGIGDAFSAMFDMWKEGSDAQQSQAKSTATATNQLTNAVTDEAQAQREVASARKEATNDLRNLNNELRGSVLNEAQAILDLQKARDRFAKGGFENETERQQALLDIAKGEQNISEVRERNNQLQQKANEDSAKGVEGSDKVTQALENQTRASQATAAAMQAIADSQAAGATSKFNDALKQLSPNAREAVLAVAGMKGEIFDFRMMLQDKIFEGVGPALMNSFHTLEPILRTGMGNIAEGLNQNILKIFDVLDSKQGQSIIERILGGTAEAQKSFTAFLDPFIRGMGTLMAAGSEHLPQLIDLFTRLATRFNDFITVADKTGKLDEWMDRGITALENIVEIGLNAIKIINDLSNAFDGDLLVTIRDLTQKLHDFLSSEQGQQKMKDFIKEAKGLWEEWKPILKELPDLFSRLADVAKRALDIILPILQGTLGALEKLPGVVELFAAAWITAKMASAIGKVVSLGKTIGTLVTNLVSLPGLLARVPAQVPGVPVGAPAAVGTAAAAGGAIAGIAAIGAGALQGQQASQAAGGGGLAQIQGGGAEGLAVAALGPAGFLLPQLVDFGVFSSAADNLRKQVRDKLYQKYVDAGLTDDAAKKIYGPEANSGMDRTALEELARKHGADFAVGGYTDWPQQVGRAALLHGKEYVQPADTVSHYGIDAMEAIHQKRIPKQMLTKKSAAAAKYGFKRGGQVSFDAGGYVDPNTGQWVPYHAAGPADTRNPANTGFASAITTGVQSGAQVGSNLINQGLSMLPGTSGAAGGAPPMAMNPLGVMGPAPGPVPGTPGVGGAGTTGTGPTISIGGMNLQIPGMEMPADRGWGAGGPPAGLGGGQDAFDIRNFGIGPGPPGSGPADWGQFAAQTGANLLTGVFNATVVKGLLGFFGAEGLVDSPYFQAATGLVSHFAESPGVQGTSAQGPGAADTNAQVGSLLDTYYNMPTNPATGVPNIPSVIDPSTGSALNPSGPGNGGLQTNTLKGKAIIQKTFPWATNIGGVRADRLKWHPQGLALDVMIPGAGGLNDPTPPAGKAMGDQLYNWLKAHQQELGIDYMLWQEQDHFNHIHVNFAPSGYPSGQAAAAIIGGGASPAGGGSKPAASKPWFPGKGSLIGSAGSGHYKGGLVSFEEGGQIGSTTFPYGPYKVPYDPDNPTGGGNFNPNIKIDLSHAAYAPKPFEWGQYGVMVTGGKQIPNNQNKALYDQGGWLMPGSTLAHNNTGRPELILPPDASTSFYNGGLARTGVVLPPPPYKNDPITAKPIIARPSPSPTPSAPPATAPPTVGPGAAPPAAPPPPPTEAPAEGPPGGVIPQIVGPGPGVNAQGGSTMHLHPALQKGIASGAAVLGNIAAAAASMGMAAGGAGAGGGAAGALISGLFTQGGKILTNLANVGASFLVGNVTNGTTDNPYGVTQRGSNPTGGSPTVVDHSVNMGNVTTQDPDAFFKQIDRREAQSRAMLGRFG